MNIWDAFDEASSDNERWKLLLEDEERNFEILLDNDSTYVRFYGEPDEGEWHEFDYYIGNSSGVEFLLTELGFDWEGV